MTLRNQEGEKRYFHYFRINDVGDGYVFEDYLSKGCVQMLMKGGDIDILIRETRDYGVPSTYTFTIPAEVNIGEAIKSLNE